MARSLCRTVMLQKRIQIQYFRCDSVATAQLLCYSVECKDGTLREATMTALTSGVHIGVQV